MIKRFGVLCTTLFALPGFLCASIEPAFSAHEGEGFLESVQGSQVLHVKGSPYEMGFQHGRLLKEQIIRNITTFVSKPRPEFAERIQKFQENLPQLIGFIPTRYMDEMKGVSDGAEVPLGKILSLNLFPEMFHCTGLTFSGAASKNGDLFHVRVLDYSVGKNLQETAVLIVAQPNDGHGFLNVSYAGFIGSVTGMNVNKIAIGEIGGAGYGHWNGLPMAFLMREVLEKAGTLEEAKTVLAETPRTCEYYYVVSDGKDKSSCGVYATAGQVHFIEPGTTYALLAPGSVPKNYGLNGLDDKFFLNNYEWERMNGQTILYSSNREVLGNFFTQPKDCLAVIGCTNPGRYPVLMQRIEENYGNIDEQTLIEMIKRPVAHEGNLHNAIFKPGCLKVWIAHAGKDNAPACDQPYQCFSLETLLDR